MFLMIVGVNEFGKYIEKSPRHYTCPTYCEVQHKHININKEIENEYTVNDSELFIQPRDKSKND